MLSPPQSHVSAVSSTKGNLAQELISNEEECKAAEENDSLAWLFADSDDAGPLASNPAESRTRMTKSQDSDVVES